MWELHAGTQMCMHEDITSVLVHVSASAAARQLRDHFSPRGLSIHTTCTRVLEHACPDVDVAMNLDSDGGRVRVLEHSGQAQGLAAASRDAGRPGRLFLWWDAGSARARL